jgi:hypothetical protein
LLVFNPIQSLYFVANLRSIVSENRLHLIDRLNVCVDIWDNSWISRVSNKACQKIMNDRRILRENSNYKIWIRCLYYSYEYCISPRIIINSTHSIILLRYTFKSDIELVKKLPFAAIKYLDRHIYRIFRTFKSTFILSKIKYI